MPIQLILTEDRLIVVETDDPEVGSWAHDVEIAAEKMIASFEAGTISEAELVDWMCLRLRVAEALGDEATA